MPANSVVDVVIPARNAAATIRSAVESIQRQTVRDLRMIVIDDGSTDETAAILAALAAEDPRIVVLAGPHEGVVGALNRGLEQSTAEFFARQDADDIACSDRLARQIGYLRENEDCVAVGCDVCHVDELGRPVGTTSHYRSPDLAKPTWVPALEPYLPGPFFLARRAAMEAAGPFRPMHVAEDSDMCWRLQEVGRLHNLPEILGDYRLHPNSVSSRSIRHGRVMAVCSQVAALSAQRRRSGRPDLPFSREIMAQQDQLSSLAALTELAGRGLDQDERHWLELATGAKLMELALYRPFELDHEDCDFIALALRHSGGLPEANRASLAQMRLSMAVRLSERGRLAKAAKLVPRHRYPLVAVGTAFRLGLPPQLRHSINVLLGRQPAPPRHRDRDRAVAAADG